MELEQHAVYEFIMFFNKMYNFNVILNCLHFVTPPSNNNYGFDSTYEMVYFIFNCLYSHLHEVRHKQHVWTQIKIAMGPKHI